MKSKKTHRVAVAAVGLSLGLAGVVPAMASNSSEYHTTGLLDTVTGGGGLLGGVAGGGLLSGGLGSLLNLDLVSGLLAGRI